MRTKIRGNEYRTTILCIDSYEKDVPVGRFYNPCEADGEAFCGLVRFLSRMEDMLNTMEFPQSFTATRSFMPASKVTGEPPEKTVRKGNLATFAIRILFRQNASWQGSVTWLEGNRSQSFRSVLELVLLMDSALQGQDSAPGKIS